MSVNLSAGYNKGGNMNLCDICVREYSACVNEHENLPDIKYGNDEANTGDAVLECSWFMRKDK